uniref:NADH-ubiquinone oxidoreductase chain 4 n=1 Tax=Trichinella spiralis TaxID=6334 RepID=Q9B8B1_TRISP|nr:NADH dehydrogenase subunit 4 [Trichinella spiralis]AAK12897.1 NADH dehydrogenase subunit 4 [Trichinella spiralis]AIW57090.1 NADH dehydrogenase subunit 4 [Trichinella spiralis]QRN72123.1 NADH dehydrogenase subunit 4 [Trichinella spiralis]QRN72136.1 NADH dehydrogenase subunit 4 [Trichinella spiralis]QRN72149.1 NADH dehydrogenase subunit 4 [Trichinella spiralis]
MMSNFGSVLVFMAFGFLWWVLVGVFGSVSMLVGCSDNLSYFMVSLSFMLGMVFLVYVVVYVVGFSELVYVYFVVLVLFFLSDNVMMFYVLFEVSIVPIYFIVLGWGNQPERLMAANYLVVYTLMFSFPLLVLIIRFLVDCSVVGWASVVWVNSVVMVMMLLPFVVKLPVYLFHLWLPKAHVEAPVLGSMILASILLKTGGYGLVKVSGLNVGSGCVFGLVGLLLFLSLLSAVTTVVQNDLKKFVAYSSVTHMTMVLGLVVMGFEVLDSAVVCLMLSHGVLSNSMFFMVGMLSGSSKTRLLFKQQGLLRLSPVVWFFLVFLLFMGSSVPPSVGMVGEVSYVVCCVSVCSVNLVLLVLLFVVLLYYPLWFVCMLAVGKLSGSLVVGWTLCDLVVSGWMPCLVLLYWFNSALLV